MRLNSFFFFNNITATIRFKPVCRICRSKANHFHILPHAQLKNLLKVVSAQQHVVKPPFNRHRDQRLSHTFQRDIFHLSSFDIKRLHEHLGRTFRHQRTSSSERGYFIFGSGMRRVVLNESISGRHNERREEFEQGETGDGKVSINI